MKYALQTTLIIILAIASQNACSQLFPQKQSRIEGYVIDDSTRQPVPYAHLYSESKRMGTIANETGFFTLPADIGDTLVASALGFLGKVHVVGDLAMDRKITISLEPRLYEIEEVNIMGFRDYADFKRRFEALELPKTRLDALKEDLKEQSSVAIAGALYEKRVKEALERNNEGNIVYYSVPIKSRDDRLRENYNQVLQREAQQRIIDKKYNREIIYKVTKLSQDEITEFMGFCNFSREYLLKATEYEILVKIENKFKEYIDLKSRGELLESPIVDWQLYASAIQTDETPS